jgi:hypothetical protein
MQLSILMKYLQNPHHPWKGWQEHHRIHKTEIEHLIDRIKQGVDIDNEE